MLIFVCKSFESWIFFPYFLLWNNSKKQTCPSSISSRNLHLLSHAHHQVCRVSAAGYLPGSRCHASTSWRWQEAVYYCCKPLNIGWNFYIFSRKRRKTKLPMKSWAKSIFGELHWFSSGNWWVWASITTVFYSLMILKLKFKTKNI